MMRSNFLYTLLGGMFLSTNVFAGAEYVNVLKVLSNDDFGIIQTRSGATYLIEKGVGCLSFWRYEGKAVVISSPGLFLGVGSELVLPEVDQKCRIWDSKEITR